MKYAVLLRGVNVGGKNRVPNGELKQVLEAQGFEDVVTYINSGNAVFSSRQEPSVAKVRSALEKHFGFEIPLLILPAKKIKAIADAIPTDWTNDPPKPDKFGQKSDVLYLFDEANEPDVLEKMGYRSDVETLIYLDGAVLANVKRINQTRYSLMKLVGTPLYKQMTIRNIATAKKLAELVK